jgi:hypothetical protein
MIIVSDPVSGNDATSPHGSIHVGTLPHLSGIQ